MSERTSQAAEEQKLMEQNQLETVETSNESTAIQFIDLPEGWRTDLFEYLWLMELYMLGQTCKQMHKWTGNYFKYHFKTTSNHISENGICLFYMGIDTSGFNEFITHTVHSGVNINELRYLQRHTNDFASVNHLCLSNTEIDATRIECLKNVLAKLESVHLKEFTMWQVFGDFYDIFLQYCTKLKHLKITKDQGDVCSILRRWRNPWLLREYPNLETVHFEMRRPIRVNRLWSLFEGNPNIRSFGTNVTLLWTNRHELLESNVKLDKLYVIRGIGCENVLTEGVQQLYQLLNQLHEQGFYKRLHFNVDHFKKQDSQHLLSLHGLERLIIKDQLNGIFDLPKMMNLKVLGLPRHMSSKDIEILAASLENLEYLYIDEMKRIDISTIIAQMPRLKQFHVVVEDKGSLNLVALNKQRERLRGACKVTIFVAQDVYLMTKWKVPNGSIHLSLVDMKRNSADDLNDRFDHFYF